MAHNYQAYHPDQAHLLPASPTDWLSEDHLAYAIHDVVQELDLWAIEGAYARGRGAPPFAPQMMVGLLLYAWSRHVYSSRQIARVCIDDLGGRYLAAGYRPDYRTLNDFRLVHGAALKGLFVQSLKLCQKAGMVSLGHVALDGTKVAANASKHKAMSYGRLLEEEERLAKEVEEMMQRAARTDAWEDTLFGKEVSGSLLGEELKRRESRLSKLRAARAALEEEAKKVREAEGKPANKGGRKAKDPQDVVPKDNAQRNFTDPDSKIMKGGNGSWVQGYNGQAAVDKDHQVIVACTLTNQAADAPHLPALAEQIVANTGIVPEELSADAGYFSADNVAFVEGQGSRALIPPDRRRHGSPGEPALGVHTEERSAMSVADRMRLDTSTADGRASYGNRKTTVEPTFGQIKGCPAAPGFCGFLRRGRKKCEEEWHWACAVHNIKKYVRFLTARHLQATAA